MEIRTRVVDDLVVFGIEGDLTRLTSTAPTLHDLVKAQLAEGKRKILFNFERAGFVDSFGVRQIIETFKSTQNLGGSFKLAALPQELLLTLTITMLVPKVLDVYPSEESAIVSFAEPPQPKSV
ncbi:MAG: STAS domain-containing protein [Candidatus Aminicenantes bacterium]|nr:STAS domain-containing protein [Candidatus Aminicenantes bacterium]